jgi:glycosyltransferase involved in cell wall biosynthesis
MRRVLMISYYFPPLGGIGSVRAVKFARYLPEFDWDPVIIAPRNGAYYRDPTLEFDERKIVRTPSLEISRTAKRMIGSARGDTRPAEVGPTMDRVRRFAARWVYRPDAQVGWYPFALASARRVLRELRCDVIFSSSFPMTAHLVARQLHRESRIPWVAEFRDLWTDLSRYDSQWRRRRDEGTERSLLRASTAVVTVSDGYAKVLLGHGARSVSVITNGFDPEDFTRGPAPAGAVATYMGTYYSDRQDLRATLGVLGELSRSGPLAGLALRFIGDFPDSLRGPLIGAGLADSARCTGFVPHREALRYLGDSTLLLLAGPVSNAFPGSAIQGHIAAKVFEYLGSRRPILYVGDAGAEVETLIRELPGVACARPADSAGIREAILSLLRGGPTIDRGALDNYSRRSLTKRLAQAFEIAYRDSRAGVTSHVGSRDDGMA